MKTLFLLRHAKSSWRDGAVEDHDRDLSGRGERAAAAMGRFLTEAAVAPEHAICSTALRTRRTWEILSANWPAAPSVSFERQLYLCDAPRLLERVRELDPELGSILVIGHNPEIEKVILGLAKKGKKDNLARAAQKVPTCAFAELSLPVDDWRDIEPGSAVLEKYVIPKDLA